MDSEEHLRYLAEIQRHVVENAVQIPLVYTVIGQVYVKELQGHQKVDDRSRLYLRRRVLRGYGPGQVE
jgi:hypothetical protein